MFYFLADISFFQFFIHEVSNIRIKIIIFFLLRHQYKILLLSHMLIMLSCFQP